MLSRSRQPFAALATAGTLALAGCQSYQRRPLDAPAHLAEWRLRTPSSPEVAQFARSLAANANGPARPSTPIADAVSLGDAEIVALVFNPDLRIARLKAGVAEAAAQNAGLWEDPAISADLARFIQATAHPWKVMSSVGFTLPISGRLEIETKRAGAEHAAELARAYEAEWRTRTDLRRLWAEWSAAAERATLTRDLLASLGALVSIVDRTASAGEMPTLESRLFHIELEVRRAETVRAESARASAELAIKQLMGLAPAAPLSLLPVRSANPAREGPPAIASDADRLIEDSPALATARAEYEAAERSLELEIRKQYPDLQIGPGYGREGGMDEALLSLSLPLPVLNANRQAIAKARAERELSRAAFETALERLHSELAAARVASDSAAEQRRIIASGVVPLAEQQYADALKSAELGEVNTLLLLESLTRRQDARLRLIDATLEEALASVRLQLLAGPAADSPPAAPGPGESP